MKKEWCKNCAFYKAYYFQWSSGYGRLNNGVCSKKNENCKQFGLCENFKSNEQIEKSRYKWMLDSLEQALESINEIAQILKEKKENEKNE